MTHTLFCYGVYGLLTVVNLVFTALAYVLAPVVALFTGANGYLPNWLCWFQTQDAPLDAGWRDGYFGTFTTPPTGLSLYWLRVRWLWRNPAYGFCYWPLGIPYVPSDWIIDVLTFDATGVMTEFSAHTTDGRYFCHTKSTGLKLGYKLWWALGSDNKLLPAMPADKGPDNRIPFCFTP